MFHFSYPAQRALITKSALAGRQPPIHYIFSLVLSSLPPIYFTPCTAPHIPHSIYPHPIYLTPIRSICILILRLNRPSQHQHPCPPRNSRPTLHSFPPLHPSSQPLHCTLPFAPSLVARMYKVHIYVLYSARQQRHPRGGGWVPNALCGPRTRSSLFYTR